MSENLGLEYTQGSLLYPLKTEENKHVRKITLSKSKDKILSFLDYDDVQDSFEFLTSSKYFNSVVFNLEGADTEFLEWLKVNPKIKHTFSEDKSVYLPRIQNYFQRANILGELMRYAGEVNVAEQRLKKFNTALVRQWVDDPNKEIGKIIKDFKNHMVKSLYAFEVEHGNYRDISAFEYLLDIFTHEKIEEDFKSWYRSHA